MNEQAKNGEASNMTSHDRAIEQRLTELEIKIGLADDLLDQQNQTIFRQQQQIDALAKELSALRQQLPQDRNSSLQNLRDELPPHY